MNEPCSTRLRPTNSEQGPRNTRYQPSARDFCACQTHTARHRAQRRRAICSGCRPPRRREIRPAFPHTCFPPYYYSMSRRRTRLLATPSSAFYVSDSAYAPAPLSSHHFFHPGVLSGSPGSSRPSHLTIQRSSSSLLRSELAGTEISSSPDCLGTPPSSSSPPRGCCPAFSVGRESCLSSASSCSDGVCTIVDVGEEWGVFVPVPGCRTMPMKFRCGRRAGG